MVGVIFFVLVVILLSIPLLYVSKLSRETENNQAKTDLAKVVTKRIRVRHVLLPATCYFVTFEIEKGGKRLEFRVSGKNYGLVVEGDRGNIKYTNNILLEFNR